MTKEIFAKGLGKVVPFIDNDRYLSPDIEKTKQFLRSYSLPAGA